jgi:hypothetical protein
MTSTDWMDKESSRIAKSEQQAQNIDQQQLEASMNAQQGAPEYWKQFVEEVSVQAAAFEKSFTRLSMR